MEWLNEMDDSTMDDPEYDKILIRELFKRLEQKGSSEIEVLTNIWAEMGISASRKETRIAEIESLFYTLIENTRETDKKSLNELYAYRNTKLEEINTILAELTLPPFEVPADQKLIHLSKLLHVKCDELMCIKNERLSQLTQLKSKRAKLVLTLGIQPKAFNMKTNIPSEEEIMVLQSYISDLGKEKAKRFGKYQMMKNLVSDLFNELERVSADDFQRDLIFGDPQNFVLSDENLKKLQNLHADCEAQYKKNNDERKKLDARLEALWNRLEVSHSERDAFMAQNIGCKPSVLNVVINEVEKYEEIKRQNIGLFIEKIRPEIEIWYENCCISHEERESFRHILECNDYTEELLESHETELKRLQEFYAENETVFIKLDQWKNLWNRYLELEEKVNDPKRFENRGGALLQEGRERKEIQSGLPKLEKKLKDLTAEWSRSTGKTFRVYGMDIASYFGGQWECYYQAKENEKQERQRMKKMEINANKRGIKIQPVGSAGGIVLRKTPVKRTFTPVSPGPESGGKLRKIAGPLTPSRMNNENVNATVTKRPTPVLSTGIPVPNPRRNLKAQMQAVINTPNDIDGSMLSINEDEFQAPLIGNNNIAHSTFISIPRDMTPQKTRNVTQRPRGNGKGMRRRSRSCADLTEAVNGLGIGASKRLPIIRSNPASPHLKAYASPGSSRVPRFAVAQHKKPFIV